MKKLLFVAALLAFVAAAFFLAPRFLLNVSGNTDDQKKQNLPVGLNRPASPAAGGPGAPANTAPRRFDTFAAIQAAAGFTPLFPGGLPSGYQPWEQFVRGQDPTEVVLTFVHGENFTILIDERAHDPNTRNFLRPDIPPGQRGQGGNPQGRPPVVDIGGIQGFYAQGFSGPGNRQLADASRPPIVRDTEPHRVLFTRGDLDIIVEADLIDVPRDELIRVAAGLR